MRQIDSAERDQIEELPETERAGERRIPPMEIQQIMAFLPWLVGTFVAWMLISWMLKHLYSLLRYLWIVHYMAYNNPLVMWEIMRSDVDELAEKLAPLRESIEGDMVYRTLDGFSQPVDWAIRIARNQWYFLRHRKVYLRWLRMKL